MAASDQIIIVTTDTVPGRSVREVLGLAWGICVTNRHGNPGRQFEAADNARHEAYNSLVERAQSMGADAVVGTRGDSFVARDDNAVDREYTFYGTAVQLD